MMRKHNRGRGVALMALGLLLLSSAMALAVSNLLQEKRAGAMASTAADAVLTQISGVTVPAPGTLSTDQMQTLTVDGKEYVGVVYLPSLGLTLPVLSQCSTELLAAGPCRYAGTAAGGGFVVAGHNYRTVFGQLDRLRPGDSVVFTDVLGTEFTYTVAQTETLPGSAVTEMQSPDWALSLFTCDYTGAARITVRCDKAQN